MPIRSPLPELLDAVEKGDRAATTQFVDEYIAIAKQLVGAYFRRLSREDGEEIAVDAMLDVIASLPKYDRSKPFGPWLSTIVRRRGLDFLEKHKGEWTKGERGQVSTHVSFEDASRNDAPRQLKKDLESATARQLTGDGITASETAESEVISPRLAAMIDKLEAWMNNLTDRERALLAHYTYGASWEEVVSELTKLGAPLSIGTARVQGHRLIKRAQQELGLQIED
jgi:RNA polymerase sigma factor (sigma-70 family)